MNFVGLDLHKRYSQFSVSYQSEPLVTRAWKPTEREALVKFFGLGGPTSAALEALRIYNLARALDRGLA